MFAKEIIEGVTFYTPDGEISYRLGVAPPMPSGYDLSTLIMDIKIENDKGVSIKTVNENNMVVVIYFSGLPFQAWYENPEGTPS